MRGLLLLAVVAVLIWLGVTAFYPDKVAGGEPQEQEVRGFVTPPEDLPPVDAAPTTEHGGSTAGATASPQVELAPSTAAADEASSEPGTGSRPGAGFDLGFARGSNPALAPLLLRSMLLRDPAPLEVYMNEGDGRDLPDGTKSLVMSFWRALTGDADGAGQQLAALRESAAVTSDQVALLEAAMPEGLARPLPALGVSRDPLALAMRMVLLSERAKEATRRGDARTAAESYSALLLAELDAPWPAERETLHAWAEVLGEVQDRYRMDPAGDWPSIEHEVKSGDNLISIRKELVRNDASLLLCTGLIERVNRLGKFIQPGQTLRIPTDRPSVLVDLDARMLLYLQGDEVVKAWEVGIGKEGHETPVGCYVVGDKQTDPSWMPVGGPQLPFGHPDNPLGTRWIAWYQGGHSTSYGIHGTSDPSGVGGRVSQGCVRMRNEDVQELFDLLPVGATVVVQP